MSTSSDKSELSRKILVRGGFWIGTRYKRERVQGNLVGETHSKRASLLFFLLLFNLGWVGLIFKGLDRVMMVGFCI